MAKTIFLGFFATLKGLDTGSVLGKELEGGIFFLDCTRDHVFKVAPIASKELEQAVLVMRELRSAILSAEKEGRAKWRQESGRSVHFSLSELLSANEMAPLSSNLPPIDEPSFLKAAIERVNNRDGEERVRVVC